jgi:hypothetical protein
MRLHLNLVFILVTFYSKGKGTGKALPVAGCGSLQDCEISRLPNVIENLLIEGILSKGQFDPRVILH